MKNGNANFAALFKKYRLRSEIRSLSEFGDLLAEAGYVYESSLFTRWENGERFPRRRETLLAILRIFKKRGGISHIDEANHLLESVGQRDLDENEKSVFGFIGTSETPIQPPRSSFRNIGNKFLIPSTIVGISLVVLLSVFTSGLSAKKLMVGTDPTLPPMEYLKNEELTGYDIDLAHALAKEMNMDIFFKQIVFNDLFEALEEKQVDIVISAVSITEERKKKFDFSRPYLNAGQVMIVKDTSSINAPQELRGKKIGVQRGTTNEQEALKYTDQSLVISYDDFLQATQALLEDEVDTVFTDLPNGQGINSTHPELKMAGEPFTEEYYGIVFRRNDPLANRVDEALQRLAAEGILVELKQKWID